MWSTNFRLHNPLPPPLLSIQRGIKFQEAFILSGYSPASNHFSRIPSEKRGEGAVYANPPMSRCARLCSGDGHKQRQCTPSPWSGGVKNFHPPSVLSLLYLSLSPSVSPFPLAPDTPHLEDSPGRRKKTDTSRRKSESYFPGCFFSKLLFFLASSSSSSYLASPAYQNCKERWGEGRRRREVLTVCGVGGSRVARMADVSWESCFRNAARIVSHPWKWSGSGNEGIRCRIKPVHHLLRVELVCSIECVLLHLLKRIWEILERRSSGFCRFKDKKLFTISVSSRCCRFVFSWG